MRLNSISTPSGMICEWPVLEYTFLVPFYAVLFMWKMSEGYQPPVPASPLKGPTISSVIQPP